MAKLILFLLLSIVNKSANSLKIIEFATCTNEEACVPFRDCEAVRKILEDDRVTPDEGRHLKSIQCKVEGTMAYACCANNIPTPKYTLPKPPECGIEFSDKIVGGNVTQIDEFPWMVQIQHKNSKGKIDTHCGGVLINERYVLTAAHCNLLKIVQVRLGDWDTRTNPDCQQHNKISSESMEVNIEETCNDPYVEIPVEKTIVHENYEHRIRAKYNDIALIKLERDVQFTDFIKPICLPVDSGMIIKNLTDFALEVAGFGTTENGRRSNVMLKVDIKINSQENCDNFYKAHGVTISSKQMCAGGEEGKDSCKGDSGGPLMKQVTVKGKLAYFMLVGLVSLGPKNCGTKDQPGLYTRVSEYMDWIIDNMD